MIEVNAALALGSNDFRFEAVLEGPVTALFGVSGAGKTTLLKVLAGLLRPEGSVRFGGETWVSPGAFVPPERRGVGYVPQHAALFPHLSVRANIEYSKRGAADEIMEMLDIRALAERRPPELSGGEARRVALARALASRPRLLLLDEPWEGLELTLRDRILNHLSEVRRRFAAPVVFVTHQPAEVLGFADEVIMISGRRVAGRGRPELSLPGWSVPLYTNYWRLPVRGDRARIGGRELLLPERFDAPEIDVALAAQEVVLSAQPPGPLSARNILEGSVSRIVELGTNALVTVDVGAPVVAAVTTGAVRELGLREGSKAFCIIKATSLRARAS